MPFTPFHFGPGLLVKAAAPRHVSFAAFVAANVAIDVETLVNMIAGQTPLHAMLHTLPAAAAVGLAAGLALVGAAGAARRLGAGTAWRGSEARCGPALVGGLVGGVSHSLLDGLMHADIRPFLPVTAANPLLRLVDVGTLHALCVAAGALGAVWLAVRRVRRSPTERLP